MLRAQMIDGKLHVELATKGHVWHFLVARQFKAECMRQVGMMASREECGFDYLCADLVNTAIRAAFPEPLSLWEVLKIEASAMKGKIYGR